MHKQKTPRLSAGGSLLSVFSWFKADMTEWVRYDGHRRGTFPVYQIIIPQSSALRTYLFTQRKRAERTDVHSALCTVLWPHAAERTESLWFGFYYRVPDRAELVLEPHCPHIRTVGIHPDRNVVDRIRDDELRNGACDKLLLADHLLLAGHHSCEPEEPCLSVDLPDDRSMFDGKEVLPLVVLAGVLHFG